MKGMINSPQPRATEAGLAILDVGGNAVDAAIAAAFVQAVIDPLNASLGGFGVAQVRPAGASESVVVSFHARAPLQARPEMFELVEALPTEPFASGTYAVKGNANQIGYLSACVPGTVKGLCHLWNRFGSMDLPELLAPATAAARDGFVVTADNWSDWTEKVAPGRLDALSRFRATREAERIYSPAGVLREIGDVVLNPDCARTLSRIAATGGDAFYSGDIATAIVGDFNSNGGLISADDLANYDVEVDAPLERGYHGRRVTVPEPPAGGLVVLDILGRLDRIDLAALGHNSPRYIRVVSSAMRQAFANMRRFLGDPEFVEIPMSKILSGWPTAGASGSAGVEDVPHPAQAEETTQLTVVDELGTCVTVTQTLGAASGVVTPGLGFLYNGAMHRFDPIAGRPNSIAPRKRRTTGISPTIVWRGAEPEFILGGAGGLSIIGGVVQVLLNLVDFQMDPLTSVSLPRFHCEESVITLEGRFPSHIASALSSSGESVRLSARSYDRSVAASVHVVVRSADGRLAGGADPRHGGIPMSNFSVA
jgi:gamma-glutamyltranspeptidase/glutathione hydrolase